MHNRDLINLPFLSIGPRDGYENLKYDITEKNGRLAVRTEVNGEVRVYSFRELTAMVLGRLKDLAEEYLQEDISHAVISVPSYFDADQRQGIRDAAAIAGMTALRIMNEPTAACKAHQIDEPMDYTPNIEEKFIVIYDIGSRYSEVTLVSVDRGVVGVLSRTGDKHFGGDNFEISSREQMYSQIGRESQAIITSNSEENGVLYNEIQEEEVAPSKHSASNEYETSHQRDKLWENAPIVESQDQNSIELQKSLSLVEKVLREATLEKSQVSGVIFTGSLTHVDYIQPFFKRYFHGSKIYDETRSDQAVVDGTARQGLIFTSDVDVDTNICTLMTDTLEVSLGIETGGGVITRMMLRNTVLPARKALTFSTAADNQSKMIFNIFEGERPMASQNRLFGTLELEGIAPAPMGTPQIELSFNLDWCRILKVVARDQETGLEVKFVGKLRSRGYNFYQIETSIQEAKDNYEGDLAIKENALRSLDVEGHHEFGVLWVENNGGLCTENRECSLGWLNRI